MKSFRVFVYGSLKKGFPNHYLLKDQSFLGSTFTKNNCFHMHNLGIYPGVTNNGYEYIEGEVYEINEDCLKKLDELENNGVNYERQLIDLQRHGPAWMYFFIKEPIKATGSMDLFKCEKQIFTDTFSYLTWLPT